jgi:heat shock protein HslJ
MSVHRRHLLSLVVAALCVAGCTPSKSPEELAAADWKPATAAPAAPAAVAPALDTATTLVGYQWELKSATDGAGQSIAALFPSPDKPLGILFGDGRINLTGGCNRISAGYQLLDTTQLQVSPGMSTMMA